MNRNVVLQNFWLSGKGAALNLCPCAGLMKSWFYLHISPKHIHSYTYTHTATLTKVSFEFWLFGNP